MKKSTIKIFAPALVVLSLAGCARDISPNTYKASHVGEASFTYQGVVMSARPVNVAEGEYLGENQTGIGLGATGGLLAGSAIGGGNGNLAAMVGGAVIGGVAGAFAEKSLKEQTGMEYVVRLTNGNVMTVVQGTDSPLNPGQRVFVIVGQDGRSRVVPDQSGMAQDVQPLMTQPKKKSEVTIRHKY